MASVRVNSVVDENVYYIDVRLNIMVEEPALPLISPIEVNRRELLLRISHQKEENVFRVKPVIFWTLGWKHFKISFGDIRWKRNFALKRSVSSSKGRKMYFEKEQCPYPFADYSIEFGWFVGFIGRFEFFKMYYKNELIHEIIF